MTKVTDKRTAILDATTKLLVERGFHATPMSEIARESGVSAGIIYRYFDNKDDLIRQLYKEVKTRLSRALLDAETQKLSGMTMFRQIWLNAFHFYVSHPQDTLLLQQYENSPFVWLSEEDLTDEFKLLINWGQQATREGVLADLPTVVFYDMTIGMAMTLAKRQIAGLISLDAAGLANVADAVCRSVGA